MIPGPFCGLFPGIHPRSGHGGRRPAALHLAGQGPWPRSRSPVDALSINVPKIHDPSVPAHLVGLQRGRLGWRGEVGKIRRCQLPDIFAWPPPCYPVLAEHAIALPKQWLCRTLWPAGMGPCLNRERSGHASSGRPRLPAGPVARRPAIPVSPKRAHEDLARDKTPFP